MVDPITGIEISFYEEDPRTRTTLDFNSLQDFFWYMITNPNLEPEERLLSFGQITITIVDKTITITFTPDEDSPCDKVEFDGEFDADSGIFAIDDTEWPFEGDRFVAVTEDSQIPITLVELTGLPEGALDLLASPSNLLEALDTDSKQFHYHSLRTHWADVSIALQTSIENGDVGSMDFSLARVYAKL